MTEGRGSLPIQAGVVFSLTIYSRVLFPVSSGQTLILMSSSAFLPKWTPGQPVLLGYATLNENIKLSLLFMHVQQPVTEGLYNARHSSRL